MSHKIIRDPLYNYVAVDRQHDGWLLELLASPEFQRLRRIHQLGVSNLTYPGAEHSRLSHSLGVLHLMQIALTHLGTEDPQVRQARERLLAAALLHDIGHGPFSHVLEKVHDNRDHEYWTCRIIQSTETTVNKILRGIDPTLPNSVAALVDKDNTQYPRWQKSLLSSQLDVDRLDYLRRDSLFTGAGYGHYDWYRILHTMQFHGGLDSNRDLVWDPKAELAIEEYIFSRYYMYWNVYFHKTTRGFEQTLRAIWKHAFELFQDEGNQDLLPDLADFWKSDDPSIDQFLRIQESTVLHQIAIWSAGSNRQLADLSRRFLNRIPWAAIEAPPVKNPLDPDYSPWEEALSALVSGSVEYRPTDLYCLRDMVPPKYLEPYFPEKQGDEQEVGNAIRLVQQGENPVEISEQRSRLRPVTEKPLAKVRYFVPRELRQEANRLRQDFSSK